MVDLTLPQPLEKSKGFFVSTQQVSGLVNPQQDYIHLHIVMTILTELYVITYIGPHKIFIFLVPPPFS